MDTSRLFQVIVAGGIGLVATSAGGALTACGGPTIIPNDSGADGNIDASFPVEGPDVPPDSGSSDSAKPNDGPDGGSACLDDGGLALPAISACSSAADCTTMTHASDCCGGVRVVGVAKAAATGFDTCASQWDQAHIPGLGLCTCASTARIADDGKREVDAGTITLGCVSNRCRTSIP